MAKRFSETIKDNEGDVTVVESITDTLWIESREGYEDGRTLMAFNAEAVKKLRDLCDAHLRALETEQ